MKLVRYAALALAAGTLACSTLEVNTDYDPATDLSKYKTFTVKKGTPPKNALAAERLENALAGALAARGLSRAPDGGELNLFPHFVLGKETQVNTTGYGYGGWGGGWRYGGGGMQTTTVQEIPTGTVVVDLVDAKTNKVVWRGIAKDQISTTATPEERQQKAQEVSAKLFENFPPGAKK
jgi:hypothetical protein